MSAKPAVLQIFNGYGPGWFLITNVEYRGPVLVLPDRTVPWPIASIADASGDNLAPILTAQPKPDLVVIGTGNRLEFPPPAVRQAFRDLKIGLEIMDTGAAARIYAVCLGEGRRIAAALLPIAPA